jgi:hypothetical protein
VNDRIESEKDLRYWLVTEDRYMSAHTRDWLERTAPVQAADTLARIAQDAQPETRPVWRVMLADFAGILLFTSDAVSHQGPNARKAGTRAALMLADRDDARCLAPLARVFETRPSQQSKYQKRIEDALTRVLSQEADRRQVAAQGQAGQQDARAAVQTLAKRLWDHGGARRDLPDGFADLLLAALRYLHAPGGEPDQALLESIATSLPATPNRARVEKAAAALLALPKKPDRVG